MDSQIVEAIKEAISAMEAAKKLFKAAGFTMEGGTVSAPFNAALARLKLAVRLCDVDKAKCADPIVEQNVELLRERSTVGVQKYGTTLADNKLPHKQWLRHALEELLDGANYLQAALQEDSTRCNLCKYDHGHAIGCANNPVDMALHKGTVTYQPIDGPLKNWGD